MIPEACGIMALLSALTLMLLRVPIGITLGAVGIAGLIYLQGWAQALVQLQLVSWEIGTNFLFITLPLFIVMGQLAYHSGFATDLYDCVYKWFGKRTGGLAITSIMSSACFGAITGSSIATVSAMGNMLMPEMKRYHYDTGLASGSLASAGVLAILIPPSIPLVFYGVWTETSIGDLFIAAIIPGVILTSLFALYVYVRCKISPELGPRGPDFSAIERFNSMTKLVPSACVFILVLGGIYGGFVTPTEAAALGAMSIFIIALIKRRLTLNKVKDATEQSALLSSNIFLIFLGGMLFSRFWVQTGLTEDTINFITQAQLSPFLIMLCLVLVFVLLGAILDTFGMLIITLPLVFPLVMSLGYDRVWFGIFMVIMIELSLITPPIGINVFVMHRIIPDAPMSTLFKGSIPFVLLCLCMALLLLLVPEIALWLPSHIKSLMQ